jgi:hypothetical protein
MYSESIVATPVTARPNFVLTNGDQFPSTEDECDMVMVEVILRRVFRVVVDRVLNIADEPSRDHHVRQYFGAMRGSGINFLL